MEAARPIPATPSSRWPLVLESLAVFAMGVLFMTWMYSATGGASGNELGVPENDSGYHVRMAAMLPEYGLVKKFPWLQYAWFRDSGDDFVSHHYGFHVLLLPFVLIAKATVGNEMAGGRWAIMFYFGVMMMLFNLVLAAGNVRWRWFWLAVFFALPSQFFLRHAYIRAICPSLMLMLLMILFIVKNRPVLAGLAVLAFTHLYLGGVMYAPVIVALYALACVLGPPGARRFPVQMVLWTAGAWLLGVVTYPYFGGMFEFLKLQVFGSGLSPDIEVGQEWRSYTPAWFVIGELAPALLIVWTAALVARVRMGPSLSANETWLLLCNFAFLVLMFKARRFVEYWPAFGLLSAAFMLAPLQERLATWVRGGLQDDAPRYDWVLRVLLLGAAATGAVGVLGLLTPYVLDRFLMTPGWRSSNAPPFTAEHWPLGIFAVLFVLTPTLLTLLRRAPRWSLRFAAAGGVALGSTAALAAVGYIAGNGLKGVRNEIRCPYNLAAIRTMMAFIKENSKPGEVIFTDDWDTFPIFFYHNTHNYFVVGLDPKFTHARRPDLWDRYVSITRGQTPEEKLADVPQEDGTRKRERIKIRLTDIRDHFHAQWVICDRDHRSLARQLEKASDLAELVYPATKMSSPAAVEAEYLVFRIRAAGEVAAAPPKATTPEFDQSGVLYLSELTPVRVEQGWGDLRMDREVEGGPLRLGGVTHPRGVGTHAPSTLEYAIPAGSQRFEATVGIDASQVGCGSAIVAVLVDGKQVLRSPVLTSATAAIDVRIDVSNAKRLVLKADETPDGERCDHVDWASARFWREPTD